MPNTRRCGKDECTLHTCTAISTDQRSKTHSAVSTVICIAVEVVLATIARLVNGQRMRTRVTVLCLSVCLSVCLFVTSLLVSFHVCMTNYSYLPACSSLVFLGFQLTEFDKTVSFER